MDVFIFQKLEEKTSRINDIWYRGGRGNVLDLESLDSEELEEIQEKHPGNCFVYILQTNKQGAFYGKKKWEHLCDVVLRFEDGFVSVCLRIGLGRLGSLRLGGRGRGSYSCGSRGRRL